MPISNGHFGLEVVRILETSSESLRRNGQAVELKAMSPWGVGAGTGSRNGNGKHRGNGHSDGNGSVTPAATVTAG
jgi:hypothetical protein